MQFSPFTHFAQYCLILCFSSLHCRGCVNSDFSSFLFGVFYRGRQPAKLGAMDRTVIGPVTVEERLVIPQPDSASVPLGRRDTPVRKVRLFYHVALQPDRAAGSIQGTDRVERESLNSMILSALSIIPRH